MDDLSNSLIAYFGVLVLVISAYRDSFGEAQMQFTEAVVKAFKIPSRFKPVANMVTGVAIALLVGVVLALSSTWEVLPVAALVGLFASARAANIHDAKKADAPTEPTAITTPRRFQ